MLFVFLRKRDNNMANWYIITFEGTSLLLICTYQTFFAGLRKVKRLKCSTASKSNKLKVISRFLVKSFIRFWCTPTLLCWSTVTSSHRNQTGLWVSILYQVWPCNVSHMSYYQMSAISPWKTPACNKHANKMAVCCNEYFKRSGHLLKSMPNTLRASECAVGIAVWL